MQIHPNQVQPAQNFDVAYFLGDHTDSTTYYVRAVVYDVRTGDVLATENLTQSPNNSRLFTKTIQAPPDPIGYGRNIVAIVTVYTDSGYTTKSEVYQELSYNFLVKHENQIFGGGGVDYRTFREIIREEIREDRKNTPPPQKVDLSSLVIAIGRVQNAVNSIQFPEVSIPVPEKVDLKPVLQASQELKSLLAQLPESEKPNIEAVNKAVESLTAATETIRKATLGISRDLVIEYRKALQQIQPELVKTLQSAAKEIMSRQELTIPFSSILKINDKEDKPFDVTRLYAR